MESRQLGVPEFRQLGVPESRQLGVPESRQLGVPESRQLGVPESRQLGVPESRQLGVPESRQLGVPESRQLGVPESRQLGVPESRQLGVPESRQLGVPESRQLGVPSHLAAQCSDKILMHIHRPCNFEQTLDFGFEDLSSRRYTDVTLIADDGEEFKIHGILLSAASPYLGHLLSNTFSPNLEHTILLPDVPMSSVRVLCQLLYGAAVLLSRDQLGHLYRLVDLLSITLNLALTSQDVENLEAENNEPSQSTSDSAEAILSKTDDEKSDKADDESEVINLAVDACDNVEDLVLPTDKVSESIIKNTDSATKDIIESNSSVDQDKDDLASCSVAEREETVNTSETENPGLADLPVCCWHCNQDFETFPALSDHLALVHAGDKAKSEHRRHHRCTRCGEVVASMWKLRQHLSTHQTASRQSSKPGDHVYAGRSARCGRPLGRRQSGDHGYATAKVVAWPRIRQEAQHATPHQQGHATARIDATSSSDNATPLQKKHATDKIDATPHQQGHATAKVVAWPKIRHSVEETTASAANATPPGSSVCSEHSYGTKRDSSPECEEREEARERSDHPYSVVKCGQDDVEGVNNDGGDQVDNQVALGSDKVDGEVTITDNESIRPDHPYSTRKIAENGKLKGRRKEKVKQSTAIVPHWPKKLAKIRSAKDRPKERSSAQLPIKKKEQVSNASDTFSCDKCNKTFPASYRLKRHVREVHNKEKLHKCDSCEKEFFKSTSLLRHQVAIHTKLRPYTCSKCHLGFKDPTALKYHMQNDVCRNGKRGAKRK